MEITKKQACKFILKHHGLYSPHGLKGKSGVLEFIKKMGCIQYDPLNIVGRNPELVLQSRISNFKSEMLNELLYQDRELLDGWDKMMSIYPIEDWKYFNRKRVQSGKHVYSRKHCNEILNASEEIMEYIIQNGPVSSIDLKYKTKVDWHWGSMNLTKVALENMYYSGKLIVHHRINTRRFYDLAERHIPNEIFNAEEANETIEDYREWYVLRRIGSFGLLWNRSSEAWPRVFKSKERNETFKSLQEKGLIREIKINEIAFPFYIRTHVLPDLEASLADESKSFKSSIIAPLDNLMWDRKMVEDVFDFKYRWEVYKPVTEREYGYYVLPILCGDKFIARFEPGRDKKPKSLIIKNWWWEKNCTITIKMKNSLNQCFKRFQNFLGTENLIINEKQKRELEFLI